MMIVPGITKLEILSDSPRSSSTSSATNTDRFPLSQLSHITGFDNDKEDTLSPGYRPYFDSSFNPPKSRLSSANSTDSSVDSDGGSCVNSQPFNQSLPSMAWTKLTSFLPLPFIQSQRTSPTPQEDSSRPSSVASSNDGFPFHQTTTARDPKRQLLDEIRRRVPLSSGGGGWASATVSGTDMRREATPPSKSNSSGLRRSSTSGSRSSHERSHTWGSPSDFFTPPSEMRKISNIPKCVNTPGLSAHLRVQPYHTAGSAAPAGDDDSDCFWIPERAFDVFVHPSSLPEVFLSLDDKMSAVLVDLVPVESPTKPPQGRGGSDDPGRAGQDADFDIKRMTPVLEKQPVGGSEREQKGLPASLVVRLFFATKLWRRDDRMVALLSEQSYGKEDEIPVEIGHVLVSDLVRHQLGIATCSGVVLNHVKDEWRIAYKQAPSLHIQPLDPPIQVSPAQLVL